MKTADDLWDLLRRAESMPYGAARTALTEEVLRHADSVNDPDLAFTARIVATTAYVYGGEPAKAFVTFAWSVSDFDNNPAPYHQRFAHHLLWDFKTMVSSLTRFPEIPLARTYSVLDDMERRYREGGHSMQAVYKRRHLVARHLGQHDAEDEWFDKWQATPRDELSDCVGCDPTSVLIHLNSRGRYEESVAVAEPVLAGELTCNEQPQNILTELMEPYLMVGRHADAADAHRRAYRLHRSRLADLSDIARHVEFCARTGNEHRGLEILQRHLDWLDKSPSPASAMDFAAAGGLLLRRITELGHGDATLTRAGRDDITAAALAGELAATARELSRRFDERNGTDHQGRTVAKTLAAEPYGVTLVLDPSARPSAAPSPVAAEPESLPPVPAELTAAELLDLAREHDREERTAAASAVLAVYDERFGDVDDPLLAGRRAVLRGDELRGTRGMIPGELRAAVIAAWERGAELLDRAGEASEASAARGRVALEKAYADEFDEAAVDADVAVQEEHGGPRERAAAWARRAILYGMREHPAEANEAADRSDAYAAETGDARLVARNAMLRARHRTIAHRHEEALEAARAAWEFFRVHGPAERAGGAGVVFGQLTEDPAEQVEAFSRTLAAGPADAALVARAGRGRALMQLGRAAEATPDLVEAVALAAEQGLAEAGAFFRLELANAYRLSGRPVEGAEVAEEALRLFEGAGLPEPANETRYLLAGLYNDLGDRDAALAAYRELFERLDGNPAGRGQIAEEIGGLLYDLDRDAEAAEHFRAAAAALHESGDLIGELRAVRRLLSAQNYADDVPGAEETIRDADELWEELPAGQQAEPNAIYQRSMTGYEAAQMLMRRGRWTGAVPHLRGAPERLRGIGAVAEADRLQCMLGEALLRSGSPAEAAEVLGALLEAAAEDSPVLETAAELHAEAVKN